jgi:hypothetical protein
MRAIVKFNIRCLLIQIELYKQLQETQMTSKKKYILDANQLKA